MKVMREIFANISGCPQEEKIEAAYRRKQIDENIEHDSTNELLLRFLDLLEE